MRDRLFPDGLAASTKKFPQNCRHYQTEAFHLAIFYSQQTQIQIPDTADTLPFTVSDPDEAPAPMFDAAHHVPPILSTLVHGHTDLHISAAVQHHE